MECENCELDHGISRDRICSSSRGAQVAKSKPKSPQLLKNRIEKLEKRIHGKITVDWLEKRSDNPNALLSEEAVDMYLNVRCVDVILYEHLASLSR